VDAEGLVGVEGGARGLGILGHQFEIAERGDQRNDESHHERQPHDPADALRHLAGQRVDPRAEDVADNEQEQQPGSHHTVQAGLARRVGVIAVDVVHWLAPVM
jgi:hypothetical protein